MKLTIGMATFEDFDGVYFTVQALRAYHDMTDVEIIVVDNMGCDFTRDFIRAWVPNARYIEYFGVTGTSAPRDLIFHEAAGDIVMCVDCHVLLMPGSLYRLRKHYSDNPKCMDLIQGPMMHDDLVGLNTHFDPVWRDHMWGTWGTDPRGFDRVGEPFDIPMQGLGLFCCHKDAWLGFNARFSGFGGEEGYIHEKFRQAGRRTLCAPWLRWAHRFGRPYSVPYPLNIEDRIRNYLIGHSELNMDLAPIFDHFADYVPRQRMAALAKEALPLRDCGQYIR